MRDYKKIKAYQLADRLVLEVYKATKEFPKEEIYGLVSQLRRASVSVVCNVAEGASRQHTKDYLNFLYIARGSLAETEYLIGLSFDLKYLSEEGFKRLDILRIDTAKILYGLIEAVRKEI